MLRRLIGQAGNLALDLADVRTARPTVPIAVPAANRRRLANMLTSRSVVDRRLHTLAGRSTR
jgi:hypothetical protein